MEEKDFTIKTGKACKIIGISKPTLISWAQEKKIDAEERGGIWFFNKKDLQEKATIVARKKNFREIEQDEEEKEIASGILDDPSSDREIIVNSTKALSKKEAERIIKQEDAIRKQRENMVADGKIIFVDQIEEALSVHFGAMLQDLCSLPDVWMIKYSLTPAQATQFTTDIKLSLKTTWSKIKSKVEECYTVKHLKTS